MMHAQVTTPFTAAIRSTTLLTVLLLALLAPPARAQSLSGPEHPTLLATVALPSGVVVDITGLDVQAPPEGSPKTFAVASYIVTVTPPVGWRFSFEEQLAHDSIYQDWALTFVTSAERAVRVDVDVQDLLASEGIQLVPRGDTVFSAPLLPVVHAAEVGEMPRKFWVLAGFVLLALIAAAAIGVFGAPLPFERFMSDPTER